MKKIAFDIKYKDAIEARKVKVVTYCGFDVTIVSYNADYKKGEVDFPILGLIYGDDEKDHPEYFKTNGRYIDGAESNMDLYILIEERELTNIEHILQMFAVTILFNYSRHSKEIAKQTLEKWSERLLSVARKQLEKTLPHWKKCAEHPGEPGIFSVHVGCIEMGGYEINIGEVFDKLPKYE